ncbi:MAG: excinuclease ABC subunit UvrA [Spirochaetaceae bacterium]|nr:MAG: excinuclease ABC subunit UvrA [Spirochaetaceae bacterium]
MDKIVIRGAREHNLKDVDLVLPRDRFIVICGLSGSGKSSLAFDTIFAEGQRRYVESLSAYARQFLGRMDKPDVDYLEGLSPAISIEQKSTNRNPRSTVGTVTEIYDYYRLLFARIGIPHDPATGKRVEKQTVDEIVDRILSYPDQSRVMVLAPVVRRKKGSHQKVLEDARRSGFVRARIDGRIVSLDEPNELEKNRYHSIEVIVDRLRVSAAARDRVAEAVETAAETSAGLVIAVRRAHDSDEELEEQFSESYAYPDSNLSFPELEPRIFSFNNPYGACPGCSGLGITMEFDVRRIMPDPSLSFNQGGIVPYNPKSQWYRSRFDSLAAHLGFSLDTPLVELPEDVMHTLLHGSDATIDVSYENKSGTGRFEYQTQFPGIFADLRRRYTESTSEGVKQWLESFMSNKRCEACDGRRLRPEALAVTIAGVGIHELSAMSVSESLAFFKTVQLDTTEREIARDVLKEIRSRLHFMESVGLEYLTLDRAASTLSGGEAQRIRLATQIGSSLVGVLYILDEPTIGLHQRDNQRLLNTLLHLRDIGNTLIVVEHDEQTLMSADYIVDMGPGAGVHGGHVVAQGSVQEVIADPASVTGPWLNGSRRAPRRSGLRQGSGGTICLRGAREHNLKSIDVDFPLGTLIVITGVSGSGKSTLLSDLLYPLLLNAVSNRSEPVGAYDSISGVEKIDKVIHIDQSPIGRTPRSNPATYVGVFGTIRDLFAGLPQSRARGFKPGRFSFNVKGGRCENCQGAGTIKIEMHFLPDVFVTCDVCSGKRFNRETLEVLYKGKSIHDVLEMTVEEATQFFAAVPPVERKLRTLREVGLDYIKLGQSALTLSGGEAQRVKLALELSKTNSGRTFYILDEPTTGLHFADVARLMEVLNALVDKGNTVAVIEHNMEVILGADWVIDLGPEGGGGGGEVIVAGPPRAVGECAASYTGHWIKEYQRAQV